MLRKSRAVAALLKNLHLGAVGVATVGLAGGVLVGCEDESQPEYWVKRLKDPIKRTAAIKRLGQFYEDGMTNANNDRSKPQMKALLDKIVTPLTEAYTKDGKDIDERNRVELLRILVNTRDMRVKPAVVKAMKDFVAGKATAEEMKQSASFIIAKKKEAATPDLQGPLLDAFLKIKPTEKKTGPAYLATKKAMVSVVNKGWEAKLIEVVGRDLGPKDTNEFFWQAVSAELLGRMKSAKAVRPLFKIVLNPKKAKLQSTAIIAITRIGKNAVVPLIDIINGKDKEIVEMSKKAAGKNKVLAQAHVGSAAICLGTIGRGEAMKPMIAAIDKAEFDTHRAILGREMAKLPAIPEAFEALEKAYEKIKPDTLIPPGDTARVVIAKSAAQFMDPRLVPWLLKQIAEAKGDEQEKEAVQVALMSTAIKLMSAKQVPEVEKVINKYGHKIEKDAFKQAKAAIDSCKDKAGCYLAKLDDSKYQENKDRMVAIKSAYMLAAMGKPAVKAEIVKRLPKIENGAIAFVSALVIDHLSPQGDTAIADSLQKIVDQNNERGGKAKLKNAPLNQIIPRLRARAGK